MNVAQQPKSQTMTLSERADELEHQMEEELERVVTKSLLFNLADGKVAYDSGAALNAKYPGKYMLMGDDPRLPKMPAKPTLLDYFRYRFASMNHLLQSATHALKAGLPEKTVLACLLHDVVQEIIKVDHGWWGAQLFEPYISEKAAFAIRYHQALRFYADPANGYEYPDLYRRIFGHDYRPEPYIEATYQMVRKHKWYGEARMVTVNDLYAFDPNAQVSLDVFVDIIGRHFKQPKEGLGYDNSPVAHMWRTIERPDAPL